MQWGPNRIPISMLKMKEYGVRNPIIEIDLADDSIDWSVLCLCSSIGCPETHL